MSVTKDFLIQLVKDTVYPNNSRLVSALDIQELLIDLINNLSLDQNFEIGEVPTGVKWIDGKEIYRKVLNLTAYFSTPSHLYDRPIVIQQYMGSYFRVEHVQVIKADGSVCDLSSNDIYVRIAYNFNTGMTMNISKVTPGVPFVSGYAILSYTKGESTSY